MSVALSDAEKVAHIKKVILQAGDKLRARHPWLKKHQDAIGATIMAVSLLGMIGTATLYYHGLIAWWLCIPVVAIFASFIHELEHDLIHLMYFRNKPWANTLMLWLGWIARPSTVSPSCVATCICTITSIPAPKPISKSAASPMASPGASSD